eukprot:scaffold594113_cov41-Prasinocladus_malaysianus.AAC.1
MEPPLQYLRHFNALPICLPQLVGGFTSTRGAALRYLNALWGGSQFPHCKVPAYTPLFIPPVAPITIRYFAQVVKHIYGALLATSTSVYFH